MFYGNWLNCGGLWPVGRFQFGGAVMMIFGLILLGVVIYLLFRRGNLSAAGGAESPMEVLEKRYARGEIDREEFLEMKRNLSS